MNAHSKIIATDQDQSDQVVQPSLTAEWAEFTTPATTIPPLLEGCIGASPDTVRKAAELEALMLESEQLGCTHTAIEVDYGSGDERTLAADELYQAAMRREEEAAYALLEEPASREDACARLTLFLRNRALFATRTKDWALWTLEEAAERLSAANGYDEELGAALIYAVKFAVPLSSSIASGERFNAALAEFQAAQAALAAAEAEEDLLLDAERAIERELVEFPAELYTPSPCGGRYLRLDTEEGFRRSKCAGSSVASRASRSKARWSNSAKPGSRSGTTASTSRTECAWMPSRSFKALPRRRSRR
jgi:hypothetical protein